MITSHSVNSGEDHPGTGTVQRTAAIQKILSVGSLGINDEVKDKCKLEITVKLRQKMCQSW